METWFKTQSGSGEHHLQFGTSIKEQYELMQFVARACVDHNDAHLRELIAAEKDGRCAVMPCKVGDTIYCISGDANECDTEIEEKTVYAFLVEKDGRILLRDDPWDGSICYADELGKIVGTPFWDGHYLTRAEAEKALEKERGHDE